VIDSIDRVPLEPRGIGEVQPRDLTLVAVVVVVAVGIVELVVAAVGIVELVVAADESDGRSCLDGEWPRTRSVVSTRPTPMALGDGGGGRLRLLQRRLGVPRCQRLRHLRQTVAQGEGATNAEGQRRSPAAKEQEPEEWIQLQLRSRERGRPHS